MRVQASEDTMDESAPTATLETIPRDECVRLLATHQVGRLAVVEDDQPLVFPVNYAIEDDNVVIRMDEGTMLGASRLRRVAFEVDDIDQERRTGWSVVVQGVGHEVTDALDTMSERVRTLPVTPWPAGERSHWLRIVPREITGRRLTAPPPPG
jgi:nitroimidazol reductase NimA-like FMN-containing flavoprotein (pyridoxamine 5'-phosphate oxidase superfamily)